MLPAIVSKKFLEQLEESTNSDYEHNPGETTFSKSNKMEKRKFRRSKISPAKPSQNTFSPSQKNGAENLIFKPQRIHI